MNDIILQQYEIRKTNKEKTAFIDYLKARLSESGYHQDKDITVETKGRGLFKTRNIIVGSQEEAEIFLTAHYDTCAVMFLPNLMSPTNPILFWAYQLILAFMIMVLAGVLAFIFVLLSKNFFDASTIYVVILMLMIIQLMVGFKNKHNANDNTSGVITITRLLEELPKEQRGKVCVVYFDNEEKGLLGSAFFKKKHKKTMKDKLLINFDCVGDGRNVVSMAKRKARTDKNYNLLIEVFNKGADDFDVHYLGKKMLPMMFPSDQSNFSKGIGVCSLRKSLIGMYTARIHTPFDTCCRRENIEFLVRAMREFIEKI